MGEYVPDHPEVPLSGECIEGALDISDGLRALIGHRGENCRRGLVAQSLNILQGYVDLKLYLVLKINAPPGAGVFDFVVRGIPNDRVEYLHSTSPRSAATTDFAGKNSSSNQHDESVFAGVTQIIEGVHKIIPSTVTIEASKERLDFRRGVFGRSLHPISEVSSGFGERECSKVGLIQRSGSVDGMIEACAHMLDDFSGEQVPLSGKPLEANLVDGMNAIRVQLGNASAFVFSEELNNLGFKLVEMFICSRET